MAQENPPGVRFIENVEPLQITSAGATTCALIGTARRGRTDKAMPVSSWAEFRRLYGGLSDDTTSDLGMYAWQFYANGGAQAYIARIVGANAAAARNTTGALNKASGNNVAFELWAQNEGAWGNRLSVSLLRHEVIAIGSPSATDANGDDLPSAANNAAQSLNGGRLRVASLVNIAIGDIFDVFDPADGSQVTEGPIVVIGTEPSTNDIYFVAPTNFIANCPAGAILRTNSQHAARTQGTLQLANGQLYTAVQSVDGITEGSLLSFHLWSHVPTAVERGIAQLVHVVVDRVVGTNVYFKAAATNVATIPLSTNAYLRHDFGAGEGINFESKYPGPQGNTYSVQIRTGQAANAITVTGRAIRIDVQNWDNDAVVAAVNAHAVAGQLVTASVIDANNVAVTALPVTFLTGGAAMQCESQEFYLRIAEYGTEVEVGKHQFLSCIYTSPNYVGKRLGGTSSPVAPADTNTSLYLIIPGADGDVDAAASEITQLPRAINTVMLGSGADGSAPTDDDIIGAANPRSGIYLLDEYDGIDFAAVPGETSALVQLACLAYAEARGKMAWYLDTPLDATSTEAIMLHRQQNLGVSNTYGLLYGPWGRIRDPRPNAPADTIIDVPATPAALGLTVKAISTYGVHYSPGNMVPAGWVGVKFNVSERDHGALNENGINIFRYVGRTLRLYGDRTLGVAGSRKFGTVRRWLNYFKQSLVVSLAPLQFKPANSRLFGSIEHSVRAFLHEEWRNGALYPDTNEARAYYVKCDTENNTGENLDRGEVNAAVGVSPVVPAELINFYINVGSGGVNVAEAN